MKSLNNVKQVQSDYLKRVERLCGEEKAEIENIYLLAYLNVFKTLPKNVLRSHYRSLATGISKPSKYQTKVKTKL